MRYFVGVDTGGTFTDCVVMDSDGQVSVGKAPSTPRDFARGIIEAVASTAEGIGMELEELLADSVLFSHAATTATNALLTRSGATTGLVTTRGFEDTLLIMRVMGKYAGLGEAAIKRQVKTDKPDPLVPRRLIRGLNERVDYKGSIVAPLDRGEVERSIGELFEEGAEAIAVCLLWSHRNPAHEQLVRGVIDEVAPGTYVTLSSDLVPVLGEYERTATTTMNSYLGPPISRYLEHLEDRLQNEQLEPTPLVAQAHGGSLNIKQAARQPVSMIHSGPVCGVLGSQYLAGLLGFTNVIAADMGGTSFDVGVIHDGQAEPAIETVVSQYHLLVPMVGVESIGAGAGSIASVETEIGRLRVGPDSAGADPGPACYDAGGDLPTVTDADLVLGLLNPGTFLGGRRRLVPKRSWEAIGKHVAEPLGMDTREAAAGIHEIVNAHMSDLIRSVTVGRGHDPRRFAIFAYGGAGPLHAYAFGAQAATIVVPGTASVHSALGALTSNMVRVYQQSAPMRVPANPDRVNEVFGALEGRALKELEGDGYKGDQIAVSRYVTMRHIRQVHEVRVPCPLGQLDREGLELVGAEFERIYERAYGKGSAFKEAGTQMITFGVEAYGMIRKPTLTTEDEGPADPSLAHKGRRQATLHGATIGVDVFDHDKLLSGNMFSGPAIIETPITTIVIDEGQTAEVDRFKNIVIERSNNDG